MRPEQGCWPPSRVRRIIGTRFVTIREADGRMNPTVLNWNGS